MDPYCWQWTAATAGKMGHGVIGSGGHNGPMIYAHRVAWELASGEPVPDGLDVLHTCDNPPCVRNDEPGTYEVAGVLLPRWGHLFLGTNTDNALDMVAKGRARPPCLAGERHGRAKLSAAEVEDIRRRYAAGGQTQKGLAREYGVAKSLVWQILKGEIWTHAAP